MIMYCDIGAGISSFLLKLVFIMGYRATQKEVEQKFLPRVGSCLDMTMLFWVKCSEFRAAKLLNAYNSMDCYLETWKTRMLRERQMVEACEILEGSKNTLKAVCVIGTIKNL